MNPQDDTSRLDLTAGADPSTMAIESGPIIDAGDP